MDKSIYPDMVDFDYKVRCDKHNLKPYEYCEMCMIRTELQNCLDKSIKSTQECLSSCYLAISILTDVTEKHRKQIDELNIKLTLQTIKEK